MLVGQRKYVQFQYVQFPCSAVEWAVARADLRLGTATLMITAFEDGDRAGLGSESKVSDALPAIASKRSPGT